MGTEDSPSIDNFEFDPLDIQKDEKSNDKKFTRLLIGILGIIIIILIGLNWFTGSETLPFSRNGVLTGYVVNESQQPIRAEIIVFDAGIIEQADENGFFEIRNVPTGEQSIIVGYNQRGVELIAYINSGERTHLGTIEVPTEMEIE
jgi:hypothetical protein